ncbi:MAG: phenylalanine--tRNA ligase subunit beta, partial [Actinobacteria bacterium]|nr:phenylalanine--tRNA ligase subunit beta [Actinomycetota bacterium]
KIGSITIKKSKIRGEYSEGMMCSEAELGLSSESEGIMILDKTYPVGENYAKIAGFDDIVFELEITPNRPDCLSIIGIAREISAAGGYGLIIPEFDMSGKVNIDSDLEIKIEEESLCPRYSAKIFKDIPSKESPQWLKNRLLLCGIRSIDLIVDLTNYIMLETGQPLHAFDADLLFSSKIIIRKADKGEKIRTIDDISRKLDGDALVIADEKKAIALAGIMGGKKTEINPDTRNVLLESANFSGPSIMLTSQKTGLRSEASNRFEKKIDPELTVFALERFSQIFEKITDHKNSSGSYDNYIKTPRERKISLRPGRVRQILGQDIGIKKISDILNALKIKNTVNKDELDVIVPSFRFEDLEREIDLIEEVARMYGYNNIKSQPTILSKNRGKYSRAQSTVKSIRQILADMGSNEVINYSFISMEEFLSLALDKEKDFKDYIKIANPINEDFVIMRTILLPSLIKTVKNNINRNIKDISIFEISKVFISKHGSELPEERLKLGVLLSGRAAVKSWNDDKRGFDFFDLKGMLESITCRFYIEPKIDIFEKEYTFFHPGISGDLLIDGKTMGILGKVNPLILENIEIVQDIFYAEIDLDIFNANMKGLREYKKISAFPSVEIDIAIVVEEKIKNKDIFEVIKNSGTGILKNIRLFDIYRGKQIEEGKKSLAYSLSFRDENRTLKDTEVDIISNRIIESLEKKFNARLRA